jgi:hypothetical protein
MREFFSSFLLITGWLIIAWGIYFLAWFLIMFYAFPYASCILSAGWLCLFLSKKLDPKPSAKRS